MRNIEIGRNFDKLAPNFIDELQSMESQMHVSVCCLKFDSLKNLNCNCVTSYMLEFGTRYKSAGSHYFAPVSFTNKTTPNFTSKHNYRAFHGFGQAKFPDGGLVLGSRQFSILPQLPL